MSFWSTILGETGFWSAIVGAIVGGIIAAVISGFIAIFKVFASAPEALEEF